jgi:hypothetical protein
MVLRVSKARAHGVRPAFLSLLAEQRRTQHRLGGGVGILVESHVDAPPARLVDEPQRLPAAAPVVLARDLVVTDMGWESTLLADGDGLADALDDIPRLVAHV